MKKIYKNSATPPKKNKSVNEHWQKKRGASQR
jgi:hypothetical protein